MPRRLAGRRTGPMHSTMVAGTAVASLYDSSQRYRAARRTRASTREAGGPSEGRRFSEPPPIRPCATHMSSSCSGLACQRRVVFGAIRNRSRTKHSPKLSNFGFWRRRPDLNQGWRFCRFNGVVNRVVSCWSLVLPAISFYPVFWALMDDIWTTTQPWPRVAQERTPERAKYACLLPVSTPVQNLTVPPDENLTDRRGDEPQFVGAS